MLILYTETLSLNGVSCKVLAIQCPHKDRIYKKWVVPSKLSKDEEFHFPSLKSARLYVLQGELRRHQKKLVSDRSSADKTDTQQKKLVGDRASADKSDTHAQKKIKISCVEELQSVAMQLEAKILGKEDGSLGKRPSLHIPLMAKQSVWLVFADQPYVCIDEEIIEPWHTGKFDHQALAKLLSVVPDAARQIQAYHEDVPLFRLYPMYAERVITKDVAHLHGESDHYVQEWIYSTTENPSDRDDMD